jgi:hypothetical protein
MQKNNMVVSDDAKSAVNTEDIHDVRRANLLLLLREFSQARIASGEPTNGTEKAFAEQLQVSKSLLSQLKTSRPISNANAKQIEARCKKSAGWLSVIRVEEAPRPAPGEEAFVAIARVAYRNANKVKRAQLLTLFVTQR